MPERIGAETPHVERRKSNGRGWPAGIPPGGKIVPDKEEQKQTDPRGRNQLPRLFAQAERLHVLT